MTRSRRQPWSNRPTFFWQAALISLPVIVLVVFSLVSMRRDEQAAEQDARNRAVQNAQNLALALRIAADDELQRYLTLQNTWMIGLHSASQPSTDGVFWDDKLKTDINRWEKTYHLKFEDLAVPEANILVDGRLIRPWDIAPAPRPPKWFRDLTPEQRKLWETLRRTVDSGGGTANIQAAANKFVESGPSDDANNAAYHMTQPLSEVPGESDPSPTETGISFQDTACYRVLKATNRPLPDSFLNNIWYRLFEKPSFVAPVLLRMTEERVATTNRVRWMRQLWDAQSKVRAWSVPLRTHPELTNHWNPPSFWSAWAGRADEALALFEPGTFTNMGSDHDGVPFSGHGYDVWFIPRDVVESIFAHALTENRSLVPNYVEVDIDVSGKPVLSSANANSSHLLLATARQKAGPKMVSDAVPFDVHFYLTSRDQMLSAERHRSKRLVLLVLASALAAFAGLFSAYRAFRRQEQLNELKSNFVSSVSHELRTPIASVRLMAENLERGAIPEAKKQNDYFRFIVQECRRLSGLIENILDFSRIEQGRKQYDFEPTDIVALARQTIRLMEPAAADRQIRLEIALPAETIAAEVDGKAIQQALVNLVDNAVKHSPKGGTVRIGMEFTAKACRLWVEDDGDGIAPEEHEKIFERFYRCGSELRRETEGVGIGLSIVKHIVDAHHGHIMVRSAPGTGSRFTIELPINHSMQG